MHEVAFRRTQALQRKWAGLSTNDQVDAALDNQSFVEMHGLIAGNIYLLQTQCHAGQWLCRLLMGSMQVPKGLMGNWLQHMSQQASSQSCNSLQA